MKKHFGRTADDVEIVEGLVVFTNEMRVGVVRLDRATDDGWFDVDYPDGGGAMQNAERVATRFEGRDALTEYNRERGAARHEPEDAEF